jgi:hypothetical protein
VNLIERSIALTYCRVSSQGGPVEDADQLALYTAMVVLRGGRCLEDDAYADTVAWVAEHGPPTREKLERWAAGLDLDAALAEASLRVRHETRSDGR